MTLAVTTLQEHEATIERGLATFVEVGEALQAIRDERLYKENYGTFEVYCRERWDFTDQRARQLMAAAKTATTVAVTTERQARELAPLIGDLEAMQDALAEAKSAGPATAAKVREAVRKRRQPPATPEEDEEDRRAALITEFFAALDKVNAVFVATSAVALADSFSVEERTVLWEGPLKFAMGFLNEVEMILMEDSHGSDK